MVHPGFHMLAAGALSYLEESKLTDRTKMRYITHGKRFLDWALWEALDFSTAAQLDILLVMFFVHLSLDGFDTTTGKTTVSALRHLLPNLLGGKVLLPRSSRALEGWKVRTPPRMRLPIPRCAAAAIAGFLLHQGLIRMAIFVVLMFDAYLRPSECLRLTTKSLIPPVDGAQAPHHQWGLIINDARDERPGKTGLLDESVMVDSPMVARLLQALKHVGSPDQPLWEFTADQIRDQFNKAAAAMGLAPGAFSLHSLRHGGASHDLLTARRTILQTKDRGRWVTDGSLRRYGKRSRLQEQINKVPKEVRDFGDRIWDNFADILEEFGTKRYMPIVLPKVTPTSTPKPRALPQITRRRVHI